MRIFFHVFGCIVSATQRLAILRDFTGVPYQIPYIDFSPRGDVIS